MIKVSVLYPHTEGGTFNTDYYINVHLPLSVSRQGPLLKGLQAEKGISGVPSGTPPPYVALCHFLYDSIEDFFAAFLPHMAELTADMKHYTDITPLIQISEVKMMA